MLLIKLVNANKGGHSSFWVPQNEFKDFFQFIQLNKPCEVDDG